LKLRLRRRKQANALTFDEAEQLGREWRRSAQ
jgi:hypothetical protein